jgi:hypothetical protein
MKSYESNGIEVSQKKRHLLYGLHLLQINLSTSNRNIFTVVSAYFVYDF